MKTIVTIILSTLLCSSASALDLGKPFKKMTDWVAVRSGAKPTGDNINKASTNAAATAEEIKAAVAEIKPKAGLAVESVTRTSDAAGDLLISIKWPLIVGAYCGALWLASGAYRGWRESWPQSEASSFAADLKLRKGLEEGRSVRGLKLSSRFVLIGSGALLVFVTVFAIHLGLDSRLTVDANLMPYLMVAAFRSLIAAALLFWIPISRAWVGVGLGAMASIAMFAMIAFGPSTPTRDGVSPTPQANTPSYDSGNRLG